MSFSKLILLLFTISKIYHLGANKTASSIIDESSEVKLENLLTEFMTDLKQFEFEKLDPPRLILLGKDENFLQATKVLLESGTPYFVGTNAENLVLPPHFGAKSIVLFFIDRFTDSEMKSIFSELPSDYRCKVSLISLHGNRSGESIATTLASADEMKMKNVQSLRFDGRVINIYAQRLHAGCAVSMKLMNTWVPKKGFSSNREILKRRSRLDGRGCPLLVSTIQSAPTMELQEDKNNTLRIKGGLEGHLILNIAKHLNLVPVVKVPSVTENFLVQPDGQVVGIVADVARKLANIGIRQIRPTLDGSKLVDYTVSYNHECMVWTVPLITKNNHQVVMSEFSTTTWILVILSVSLYCGLVHVIPRLNLGHRSSLGIFDVIAVTLNYAIPRVPSGLLSRLIFLLFLHYSRVISTAYSTSLSSILTTKTPEIAFNSEMEILAAGLRTAGTQGSREMLAGLIPANSTRLELVKRFEVITSVEEALARISDRQDLAYLRQYSAIVHAAKERSMAGKPVGFHPIRGCVISYNTVMATQKGSYLTSHINEIIMRLGEAGIHTHWLNLDHASHSQNVKLEFNSDSLSRHQSIFLLYLCCLIPAFLAFATELIAVKLKLDWFTR